MIPENRQNNYFFACSSVVFYQGHESGLENTLRGTIEGQTSIFANGIVGIFWKIDM